MNFLSHFYFDRTTDNCYHILGTVLPDLLKNADKTIIIHPEKLHHPNLSISNIITGWQKHLEVDKYFHSSEFFISRSHQLKNKLLPAIKGSPVKPFFLGHIALELLLDNLLITTGVITIDNFYGHLATCEDDKIREFLLFSGMRNPEIFVRFYADFKKSRYLESYADTMKIAYALKRVCMRIWANPFTPLQEEQMTTVLTDYRLIIRDDFLSVFDEIEQKLILD